MPRGYVDQIEAFTYRGRLVDAYVVRPAASTDERQDPHRDRAFWTVTVDDARFVVFPASPDDTQDDIRARIKQWLDQRLARNLSQ